MALSRRGFLGAVAAALPFAWLAKRVVAAPSQPSGPVTEIRGCRLNFDDPLALDVQAFRETADGWELLVRCRWVNPAAGQALLADAEPGSGATLGRYKVAWVRALPGVGGGHADAPAAEFLSWANAQAMAGAAVTWEVFDHPTTKGYKVVYATEVCTP